MAESVIEQPTTAPLPIHHPSSITPTIGEKDAGSPGDVIPTGGGDHPSSRTPLTSPPLTDDGSGVVSSEEMLRRCQERLRDRPTELWGSTVRASTVTLMVGETSAGKTVFLHNMAYNLATGQEFLGFKPHRPLRVLSVDFESNDEIRATHLSTIGYAPGWDFYDRTQDLSTIPPEKRGAELVRRLAKVLRARPYDIVIVDPLVEAYPVEDENSNTDANPQMEAFRRLARSTQAGVILVHNAGLKGANIFPKEQHKGLSRGASARVDRADIVLNFTESNETERVLTVVKSRFGNLGEQLRVRFSDELGFTLDPSSSAASQPVVDQLCVDSLRVVQEETGQGQPQVTRKTLMQRLNVAEGSARSVALDRALGRQVREGKLHRPAKGVYTLVTKTEEVDLVN